MGLLDDAIREHLDLKRRRGADPTEVDRLEHEALGPVRRAQHVADEPLLDDDQMQHEDAETLLYDDEADEIYADAGEVAPELADEQHEPFPEHESEQDRPHQPAEAWDPDQTLVSDEPAAPLAEPSPQSHHPGAEPTAPTEPGGKPFEQAGGETVEYDVETEGLESADEDVLEETPEFLQDTPDHDRLWFEQRPPKDFDFDK